MCWGVRDWVLAPGERVNGLGARAQSNQGHQAAGGAQAGERPRVWAEGLCCAVLGVVGV